MHESSPVVVSFYTLDSPYEQEVVNLIHSCEQFSLSTHIEGVSSFGSWELNCAHKPTFLLATLKKLKRPLLWVDADALFTQKPDFSIFENCDIALRINSIYPEGHHERVYSGTLFVNATPAAENLLEKWKEECQKRREIHPCFMQHLERDTYFWDQVALNQVILENKGAMIKGIPTSYCKIFDLDTDTQSVIEHRQASRRFKHLM